MRVILNILLVVTVVIVSQETTKAQARLEIQNNSMRDMTVKVMKSDSGNGTLHEIVSISSYMTKTVYFSDTGYYFTKTQAVLSGKDPVYRKGEPFRVYNGSDGYSVLTLTFSITETSIPQVTGGKSINKSEFDTN